MEHESISYVYYLPNDAKITTRRERKEPKS